LIDRDETRYHKEPAEENELNEYLHIPYSENELGGKKGAQGGQIFGAPLATKDSRLVNRISAICTLLFVLWSLILCVGQLDDH
jgi:hypothetical protein